jgi:hypothetical protein
LTGAEGAAGARPLPGAGLCGACGHGTVLENRRGSRFLLCTLSRHDPSFPRYPPLPVLACRGFQPASPASGGG